MGISSQVGKKIQPSPVLGKKKKRRVYAMEEKRIPQEEEEERELTDAELKVKLQMDACLPSSLMCVQLLGAQINEGKTKYEGELHVITQQFFENNSPGKIFGSDGSVIVRLTIWEPGLKKIIQQNRFGNFFVTGGVIERPKAKYDFGWEVHLSSKSTLTVAQGSKPKPVSPYSILKSYKGPVEDICIGGFVGRILHAAM
jgi:hypothetical protein